MNTHTYTHTLQCQLDIHLTSIRSMILHESVAFEILKSESFYYLRLCYFII